MTALQNSTWMIRPTELERRIGRLLRGPDGHDGGDTGSGDAGDATTGAADATTDTTGDDTTLLGSAGSDAAATDGDQAGGDKAADDKADDADAGLPEKYELAPPEGYDEIDTALLEQADPIFRELGLGVEQAQKLVPLVPLVHERIAEQQRLDFEATSTAWAKEAKADPHMGGAKWKETETLVAKAKDLAATKLPPITREIDGKAVEVSGREQVKEFEQLLNDTRLGNHPVMLRMFRFFGQAISEDSDFIRADGGAQVKQPREAILYPHDVKERN